MSAHRLQRTGAAVLISTTLVVGLAACESTGGPAMGAPTPSATVMPQDDLKTLDAAVGDGEQLAAAVDSDLARTDG